VKIRKRVRLRRVVILTLSGSIFLATLLGYGTSEATGQWVAVQTLTASVLPMGFTTSPNGTVWIGADLQAAGSGYLLSFIQSGGTWIRSATIPIFNSAATRVSFGLTSDQDGSLWFTPTNNEVQQAVESGGTWTLQSPIAVGNGGHGLTQGLDGSIWVTNEGDDTVQEIAKDDGVWTAQPPIAVGHQPQAITTASDGSIWIANSSSLSSSVQQIVDTNGVWSAQPPIAVGDDPASLTAGKDDSIWVANEGDDEVQQIKSVNGEWIAQSPISVSPGPQALTTGVDGSIWIGESSNRVQQIANVGGTWSAQTPINGGGDPATMGATSDGSIWAVNANASTVTRYSNAQVVTTTTEGSPSVKAPGEPRSVRVTSRKSEVTVSWKAPQSDGGLPITSYLVLTMPGSRGCRTKGSLTCKVVGLHLGATYSFYVTAANKHGTGPRSRRLVSRIN
jgi:streptogramin lyase